MLDPTGFTILVAAMAVAIVILVLAAYIAVGRDARRNNDDIGGDGSRL
jgi:hypothetical protein